MLSENSKIPVKFLVSLPVFGCTKHYLVEDIYFSTLFSYVIVLLNKFQI